MAAIKGFRIWDEEFDRENFTLNEIAVSNLQAALISAMVEAREEQGISQRKLAELSGVKQPVIARIEKGYSNPRLDTILKLLAALGKTLAIVPLKTGAQ